MFAVLKRAAQLCACVVFACALPTLASPSETPGAPVRLGVYNFPPIAMVNQHQQAEGLLGELLSEFAQAHDGLSFNVVHTSPKRRHMDFTSGLFDVMFFEHPSWSWNPDAIEVSSPMLRDEEVYVALKKEGRDQSFFADIQKRRIVAIAGYHYGFSDRETDPAQLQEDFDIELSHSHSRNLHLIEADRPSIAEVAVVSRSFLHTYLSRFPQKKDQLLISDRIDQAYELHIVTRRQGPISAGQIERWLEPLIENGRYRELVRQYGLQLPQGMTRSP